jgi:hypothetical protein
MANGQSVLDFYSIFCGVFLYEEKKLNSAYVPWTSRLASAAMFYDYINRTYYQNYFNNIFKGIDNNLVTPNNSFLEHNTVNAILIKPLEFEIGKDQSIRISIPYFDCFLFSDGVGIFCFKVQAAEGQPIDYSAISSLLGQIRNPQGIIKFDNRQTTILEWIQKQLEAGFHISKDWNRYLNQLKFYCAINDSGINKIQETEDQTLFELAHTMPIGTIQSNLNDKPTEPYFLDTMNKNSISVYENWKAISLLDSFTRISCNYHDTFKTWELDYFHIYIHCLYSKFQLYYFNSQLTDLLQLNKKTQTIRDRFVEFVNDYSLPYISYKFLPNLLYEKINTSLEVQKELDGMEKKVDRLNEAYQNKKSKQLNSLLLVISILSLASVFNDISQWLTNMGTPERWVYNPISILLATTALITTAWLVYKKS